MLGQIVYRAQRGGKLGVEETSLCGVKILRLGFDPDSIWAGWSVKRAGRFLVGAGVRRILTPEYFEQWESLQKLGLREVNPVGFLRVHATPLTLAALKKRGNRPERCAVALRGERVDRGVERTAMELCARVRDVCISFPKGGEALRKQLRWELGAAVRPDYADVESAVRYTNDTWEQGGTVLDLFAPRPEPGGVEVKLAGLSQSDTKDLHLAAVLWEVGRIGVEDLEFT